MNFKCWIRIWKAEFKSSFNFNLRNYQLERKLLKCKINQKLLQFRLKIVFFFSNPYPNLKECYSEIQTNFIFIVWKISVVFREKELPPPPRNELYTFAKRWWGWGRVDYLQAILNNCNSTVEMSCYRIRAVPCTIWRKISDYKLNMNFEFTNVLI